MHPHLSQDPLTGQTILLGPMSTLVHTDQICKYLGDFSTVICPKLNYLRKRGNFREESISTQKLQYRATVSPPGLSCERLWYSASHLSSLGMNLLCTMELWVSKPFYIIDVGAEKNVQAALALLIWRLIKMTMQTGTLQRNMNNQ